MAKKYNFKLQAPLIFFDLETTGTNVQVDRIVEICLAKISPDGELEVKTRRLNPEMHIPEESSEIHGIYDKDVADKPNFAAVSASLNLYMEGCDLAGFNIKRFDIPLLTEEFKRAGHSFSVQNRNLIDMQTIFHKQEPRTLEAALRFYCGRTLEDAHSAEADVLASIDVLQGQMEKYRDLPQDMPSLHEFCSQKAPNWIDSTGKFRYVAGVPCLGFSKYANTPLQTVAEENPGFFKWMLNGTFPEDAKIIAQNALQGKFPAEKK